MTGELRMLWRNRKHGFVSPVRFRDRSVMNIGENHFENTVLT